MSSLLSFELENDELAIKIGSAFQAHVLFGVTEGAEKTILSVTKISDFRNENTGEELYFMHEDF